MTLDLPAMQNGFHHSPTPFSKVKGLRKVFDLWLRLALTAEQSWVFLLEPLIGGANGRRSEGAEMSS